MSLRVAFLALKAINAMRQGSGVSHRIKPGLRVKSVRFEPERVLAAAERGQKRASFRAGAYVQRVARRSIRKKYVTIVIPADQEKGGQNRVYPVSPEFAEMLLSVPPIDRTGFVFNPVPSRVLKGNQRAGQDLCCRTIGRVGEAAGVVVDRKSDKTIFASAHDLRRSFGLRWSRRVMPPVLQELMRHESIETTMKFYVGQDAQSTAAELHRAFNESKPTGPEGNTFGNNDRESTAKGLTPD